MIKILPIFKGADFSPPVLFYTVCLLRNGQIAFSGK